MGKNATDIITRCTELKNFWSPRDEKMKQWYRMIEMVDELKTEKMESFVGNDPRSLYNLVLHLLDADIPHRIKEYSSTDPEMTAAVASVSGFFKTAWKDVHRTFRKTNPRQSLQRTSLGFMLATGWYADFALVTDDGSRCYDEPWNPIEVYPMWDAMLGLSEVAHIFRISSTQATTMAKKNGWALGGNYRQWRATVGRNITIYDYWWIEISDEFPFNKTVWNAIVVDTVLVKFGQTRFRRMPIYIAPVGGLPDMGALTEGVLPTYSSTLKLHTQDAGVDRWKAEIGQAIIATNENIYRTWNKWWSFSLQLLRDTAQPRIFERSRSGKAIVKPEDVFRRGAIFRGGPDDSVDFIGTPPIPLELRSTQLDLEAMMQRGGVSWSMFGNVQGQITASVMSQIAASANQVIKPFHQAFINRYEDIDNDWFADIRERGVKPYGWKYPSVLPDDVFVSADYDIEIPGDLVQRATTARMLDPDFRLSYSYVIKKLFPDIEDHMQERAQVRADQAEMHPSNALIALIQYYRRQAAYLAKIGDSGTARLYESVADATLAMLTAETQQQQQPEQVAMRAGRPETTPQRAQIPERAAETGGQ
ncbi:hypothetical protein LCGC14_0591430 [marine sediment metagenome]|uniref:Uncharacterized protein n=1 Tax=marine sediment metagenome TaxID=412755 RepID=A0A0F9TZJ4_9ZZZZ